jgi:membrane protein DedA with SNARE-associated domain
VLSIPLVETVVNVVLYIMGTAGLVGLALLMVVESFGIPPLPSEIILPFAGFLVAMGAYSFAAGFAVAMVGALAGALLAYSVGRWGRHWLVRRPWARRLGFEPKNLDRMDRFFVRRGQSTVAVARVIPVVRSYISYPAGASQMNPTRFAAYTLAGSAPFTIALMYLGYVLRSHWEVIVPYFHIVDYIAIVVIVAAVVYIGLRWTGHLGPGFPPRRVGRSPSAPHEEPPPSMTGPGSPPV